jgi:undecaprenyl-diphosphatase
MHNSFFDFIMYWASNKLIWIPLYIFILILIFREFKNQGFIILLFSIALIICSDQLTSGLIKNMVERPRPSHEAALADTIHLVKDYHGGKYGFPSSHASTSFAIAAFIFFLLRKRFSWIVFVLLPYAMLVSYSRIYLGVHYPGDVVCGMLTGIFLGYIFFKIFQRIKNYKLFGLSA